MDKIIGLGNALVDVLATLKDDTILDEMGLPKGSMQLIDDAKLQQINEKFSNMKTLLATGGSAGNTILGLSCLGAATGFIGKVGNDNYGNFFRENLQKNNIEDNLLLSDLPSGVASTFISSDGERTFGTYLGAASALRAEDLSLDMFKGYAYLYIEGYLVQDHDMILRANEEEAKAFTGKEPEEALEIIGKLCSIAIVKIGCRGSLIRKGTEEVRVSAIPVKKVIDTTGAGDYFAAGFLYGLTCGYSLEKCAKIGSILSGNVIQVIGTTISKERWDEIKLNINEVLSE